MAVKVPKWKQRTPEEILNASLPDQFLISEINSDLKPEPQEGSEE